MAALLWLLRGLCIYVTLQAVATIYFSDDEYQTRRFVSHDFFANEDSFIGQKRTDIFQANGKYSFGDQWCPYNAIKSRSTITFTVENMGCATASLKTVVNMIMRGLNEEDKIKTATQDFFDSQLFDVIKITANTRSRFLTIVTKPRSSFRLFAHLEIVSSDDTKVEFSWIKAIHNRINLNDLKIKVNGFGLLGTNKAQLEIEKPSGKDLFEIKKLDIENTEVKIFDIAKAFRIEASTIARDSDNFKHDVIESMKFTGVKGYGAFKVNDQFQIVFEAKEKDSLTDTAGFSKIKSYFFISRYFESGQLTNSFGAFLWKLPPDQKIDEVVEAITSDTKVPDLPLLKEFANQPWCMSISSKPVDIFIIPSTQNGLSECFPDQEPAKFSSGFNLKVHIKFKNNLQQCGAERSQLNAIPDIGVVQIAITNRGVKFAFPKSYDAPVKAIVKCMSGKDFPDAPLKIFGQNPNDDSVPIFKMEEFSMDPDLRVTFSLTLPERFSKIEGTELGIKGELKLTVEKKDEGWEITGSMTVKLNDIEFDVEVTKTTGGGGWKFSLKTPSITMQKIIDLFKNDQIGTHADTVPAVKQFGVNNFEIEWNIDDKGATEFLRIKGNPILFGYDGAHLEGIWWKPKNVGNVYVDNEKSGERIFATQPQNALAFGVMFQSINFDWFIKKLMGSSSMSVPFFNNMKAFFCVSNALGKIEKENEDDKLFTKTDEENSDKKKPEAGNGGKQESEEETKNKRPPNQNNREPGKRRRSRNRNPRKLNNQQAGSGPAKKFGGTPSKVETKQVAPFNSFPRRRVNNYRGRRSVKDHYAAPAVVRAESGRKDIEDEDPVKFTLNGLSGEIVRPGVSIMLQWKLPELTTACSGHAICQWLVENIGEKGEIKITGYFGGSRNIEINAHFSGISLWIVHDVLQFSEIILKLKIGTDSSLRLGITALYFNKDITSTSLKFFGNTENYIAKVTNSAWREETEKKGSTSDFHDAERKKVRETTFTLGNIEIDFSGSLILEAGFTGIVEHPWKSKGNKYFSFGNVFLSAGVSVGPIAFPAIQAGAKIILGAKAVCDDTTVCIEGYFGFDPNKPQDFWVYAKANALTIERLCTAFNYKCNLPKAIEKIGFPEGFEFSYSDPLGDGKSISSIGLNVDAGFFLSGKLVLFADGEEGDNTLAFWGKIKVEKESFEIDVKMTPINWVNGFIRIQRSADDSENGPSFYVKAKLPDELVANISGYANIFGLKAGVVVLIQESSFSFEATGPLIPGILDVNMKLNATYSSFSELSFYMEAGVETSGFAKKIGDAMKAFVDKYWDEANAKINDAKDKVRAAEQKVEAAKRPVEQWKVKIDEWKQGLQRRLDELNKRKAGLETSCKSKCGKVCVGFFNWKNQCWKIFGYWVGCLVWDSCFGKIDDIICLAKCEITKIANKFVIWLEQVSIKIQSAVGSIAKSLGDMAIGVLDAAQKVVSFGNDVLSFTQTALKSIGDAATWIASNLNNICQLSEFSLFAQMTNTFDACVGYKINLKIFGIEVKSNGQACINLEFLNNLVYGIAANTNVDKTFPKLIDTKRNIQLLNGKVKAMDDQEKNFEKEKKSGESEMNKELAKKYDEESRRRRDGIPHSPDILEWAKTYLPKKSVLPAEWQTKIDEASTMPIPEYDVRNEFITNAFMQQAPWKLYERLDVHGLTEKPIRDATVTGSIRSLDFDSKMTACERVKRAINGYKDLANGLITTAKTFKEKDDGFLAYKRSLYSQKEDLYKQIIDMEHRHNLTDADREDAYHWYNTLEDGINEMSKKSEIVMNRQDKLTIPIVRRQLDFILKKEKGSTLKDFVGVIHENAMKGYKRSSIPTAHDVDGESKLKEINKELVSIINNDDDSLTQMSERLTSLRSNIHTMSAAMKSCRDH